MSADPDPAALVGRTADQRLLGQADALLPAEVGRPVALPPDPARERLTQLGATMTGVTLIGGILLMILGVIGLIGGEDTAGLAALIVGALAAGTHWGWVHVAEIMSVRATERRDADLIATRTHWLSQIEPYTRYRVNTEVKDDGAIEIQRIAHRPVALGSDRFTFERVIERRERHDADAPGAEVTERAELMRREAAADTEREHGRYRAAADAYGGAAWRDEDEASRRAAARAASQALSDQINANLQDGPLSE